jgi:hypothetical protein
MLGALLILAFSGLPLEQQDEPDVLTVDRMIELSREFGIADHRRQIETVNEKIGLLAAVRKGKVDPRQQSTATTLRDGDKITYRAVFRNAKEKKEKVDTLIQEILDAKQQIASHPKIVIPIMEADRILAFGIPPFGQLHVDQVVGKDSFHGRFCPINTGLPRMKFTDISTRFVVDDQLLKITRPIVVVGTASYTTVIGSTNTTYAFRGITDDELAKLTKAIEESKPPRFRQVWVDSTGGFRTEAELVSFDLKVVKLERPDGKILEVEIGKLSKEDQALVKKTLGLDPL